MLILSALCLVVAILANPEGKLTRVMNWSLFRRFGKLSYFIYLAHWGIIWLLARFVVHKEFEHDPWLGAKLAPFAFLICWGLAELSWKYFEGPLLRRGQAYKYEPPPTVEPASARDSDVAPSGLMTAQTSQASH
jgi:peptidoglycan/LPS O-acetylase OafA/YrhL